MVTSILASYKTHPFLSHSMAALRRRSRDRHIEFLLLSTICLTLQSNVIVIGAGTSGLSAAHHLRNFGYKVWYPYMVKVR